MGSDSRATFASESTGRSGIPVVLRPLHTCVPGRARIHVAGLQGSATLARLLENGLERHRGVTSARANTTTGNITVLFDPATDLEILLQHAAAVLRGEIAPISRRPEDHHEWHRLTAEEVATQLKTSAATGLSNREAQERLSGFGPNELKPIARRSTAGIIADQFSTIPVAVLAGAVAVSVVTGALVDA